MMKVNVIASGSTGNCTAVTCGKNTLLLDAGIDFKRIQRALNFENPLAALITHEHSDHADKKTIAELLNRGVKVYMTAGTAQALQLNARHNLLILQPTKGGCYNAEIVLKAGCLMIFADKVTHDAAEPVSFDIIHDGQQLKYLIDSGTAPAAQITQADFLVIESNHSDAALLAADIDDFQKQRISQNHLSIEKAAAFIDAYEKDFFKEIHLVHISRRTGNAQLFKDIVQNIVGDKVQVFAH